ncbi:MAG: agmatinase [bacterium]
MTIPQELGTRITGFMGSLDDYEAAALVILGAPMDFTVSFRPGARMGPQQIRDVSFSLEEYSIYQERELAQVPFYDSGDLCLPFGNVKKSLQMIESGVKRIYRDGKFPLLLGGEHLVTIAAIAAAHSVYPDLAVLQLDAHADLRDQYEGEQYSHATVMRRVVELVGSKNVYQVGIRSGTKEEFQYARKHTNLWLDQITPAVEEVIAQVGHRPLYITLDIDVVDPAFAPGTGTPEPGGISPRELITSFSYLKQAHVIGFDLVEVAPIYDQAEITALLAAKLVREAILGFGFFHFQQGKLNPKQE